MHFGNKSASPRRRSGREPSILIVGYSLRWRRPRINRMTEGRNINLLSIGYAFRPRLRVRLTLGGFTFPRKP